MSAAAPPAAAAAADAQAGDRAQPGALPAWWPLAALILLAAVLRLSTLDLQSFWYDEAFTPDHVLHASLAATLHSMVHTENSPPLWYLIAWADSRILGTGEIALRLPSALAGIATVPVAWAIGRELAGSRAALVTAALVAVNPLFVWYSQEARVYGLFVLTGALAFLCCLRALRDPSTRNMAWFALSASLALLTHYFAVFLLIPMVLWLLRDPAARRTALLACAAPVIVGLALLPLISAQGGHGTQWIGSWPLSERLQAIPQYFLTGYSGSPLGRGIELLVALPILAGLGLWCWQVLQRPIAREVGAAAADEPPSAVAPSAGGSQRDLPAERRERHAALIAFSVAACGVLIPIVLVAFGADYLAPRNLVAAMIPVTAVIAVAMASPLSGRAGMALALLTAVAFLAVTLDVNVNTRVQRGNWRGVAKAIGAPSPTRAITTVELGSAPLEYYVHGLRNLPRAHSVLVSEIVETGYSPLRESAGEPPAPGFSLQQRRNIDGLIVFRFVSSTPREVSEATLRRHVITLAHPEVLVQDDASVSG